MPVTCPNCGAALQPTDSFCANCMCWVDELVEAAAAASAPTRRFDDGGAQWDATGGAARDASRDAVWDAVWDARGDGQGSRPGATRRYEPAQDGWSGSAQGVYPAGGQGGAWGDTQAMSVDEYNRARRQREAAWQDGGGRQRGERVAWDGDRHDNPDGRGRDCGRGQTQDDGQLVNRSALDIVLFLFFGVLEVVFCTAGVHAVVTQSWITMGICLALAVVDALLAMHFGRHLGRRTGHRALGRLLALLAIIAGLVTLVLSGVSVYRLVGVGLIEDNLGGDKVSTVPSDSDEGADGDGSDDSSGLGLGDIFRRWADEGAQSVTQDVTETIQGTAGEWLDETISAVESGIRGTLGKTVVSGYEEGLSFEEYRQLLDEDGRVPEAYRDEIAQRLANGESPEDLLEEYLG